MKQLNLFDPPSEQVRPIGNTQLVPYGIHTEASDWRVHVGYATQHVFAFPTTAMVEYLKQAYTERDSNGVLRWREQGRREVYTGDIVTAWGYAVPISHIPGLQTVLIPPQVYRAHTLHKGMTTSGKGLVAMEIVLDMLKRHLIPLPCTYDTADEKALQVSGCDILINSALKLQVKMDQRAGSVSDGGSGNLFLQVAECNPERRY